MDTIITILPFFSCVFSCIALAISLVSLRMNVDEELKILDEVMDGKSSKWIPVSWEEYDAEQADPINADDGLYVLFVRSASGGTCFPVTTGTKEHCEEYKNSFEDDEICGNGWDYIVAKVEEGKE